MLTDDGIWKVLDFGIAALAESTGTIPLGRVIGTPAYMAPEQAKGDPVDHRADVYSLGAVVYRCVTGSAPLAASDTPSLLYAVVHQMPVRSSALAPIGPAIERVLLLALAKSREARIGSAAELAAAVAAALADRLPEELARRARGLGRDQPWSEPAD